LYTEIGSHIKELKHVLTEAEKWICFLKAVHFCKNIVLQDAFIYERFHIERWGFG
jgi:hypothetical protein